ncbi:YegP family protein [Agromyces sp. NPDC058064]|uniref:YegP family protein n=1 Tax=Agromyces sp. NPDC058064 TaxID=3346322 RepID=UPI0036DF4BF3
MAGTFELSTDASGEVRFRLASSGRRVIAASQGRTTGAAAHDGIGSVRTRATVAEPVDRTE